MLTIVSELQITASLEADSSHYTLVVVIYKTPNMPVKYKYTARVFADGNTAAKETVTSLDYESVLNMFNSVGSFITSFYKKHPFNHAYKEVR